MTGSGQWALVTGASSGIGAAFAYELARRGTSVVLVARSADILEAIAATLIAKHGVKAEVVVADLTRPTGVRRVLDQLAVRGITVDILVNNAGVGLYGRFEQAPLALVTDQIQINIGALVELTHHYLPKMIERGHGAIINVASTAAFMPVPYLAIYAATKAFVLSVTEAIWAETQGTGVRVTAVCPGRTETAFFEVAGQDAAVGKAMKADRVVEIALDAVENGRCSTICGLNNWFRANSVRLLSRQMSARLLRYIMRPGHSSAAR
jgi:uncharacterized protein